jgi:hypothetical protein
MQDNNYLNINIMADHRREAFVDHIKSEIGKVPVIWDRRHDIWDTRERCLKQHIKAGAVWSLTLQDDSLVCPDFVKKAEEFIKKFDKLRKRTFSFNLYFGLRDNGLVSSAYRRGSWQHRGMKSGVAICLKTEIIPEILKYWEEPKRAEKLRIHDDSRIGVWLKSRKLKTIYPCPSLVQHRDSKSLIYDRGQMPPIRKAVYFDGNINKPTPKKRRMR